MSNKDQYDVKVNDYDGDSVAVKVFDVSDDILNKSLSVEFDRITNNKIDLSKDISNGYVLTCSNGLQCNVLIVSGDVSVNGDDYGIPFMRDTGIGAVLKSDVPSKSMRDSIGNLKIGVAVPYAPTDLTVDDDDYNEPTMLIIVGSMSNKLATRNIINIENSISNNQTELLDLVENCYLDYIEIDDYSLSDVKDGMSTHLEVAEGFDFEVVPSQFSMENVSRVKKTIAMIDNTSDIDIEK